MAFGLAPLVWLRSFEACARLPGFSQAAQELGLTPAAVSQQMRALESHLGFALFERLPRGVRLTPIGRAYVPAVRKALDELSAATIGLFGGAGPRSLTIRCAVSFAALCLAPRLGRFRAAHPQIQVRLYASIWSENLDDSRVDLEIRYGDGRWDGYEVDSLAPAVSVPVCPPGGADSLREIVARQAIHISGCEDHWSALGCQLGWPDGSVGGGVVVDTSAIALEMVAAGAGCAVVSAELARGHLAAGRVAVPAGIELRRGQGHFLLRPRRARPAPPDVLLFRDWLLGECAGPGEPGPARMST